MAMIRLLLCLPFVVAASTAVCQQTRTKHPSSDQDDAMVGLMDEVWDFELNEFPLLATDVGDPRGQDRLEHQSPLDLENRNLSRREFLRSLKRIDVRSLSAKAKIDAALLLEKLETEIADYELGMHWMPLNNREGFHLSFPELPRLMSLRNEQDFENYIARLQDFPRLTDENISLMRIGIERELVQPAIIMRDSVEQANAQVVDDPEQSLLIKNIDQQAVAKLDPAAWAQLRQQIIAAIETSVVPAYSRLADFLESEYVPACRDSIAARVLPNGKKLYQQQIRKFTTLDLSPDELHRRGIEEVDRIRGQMNAIRERVNFKGDLPAFLEFLRTDPQFYARTPEELMKEVALILKQADGRLPTLFRVLPRIPYGLREVPAYVAPQTTSAYYWPPPTDGSRGGFYYVNTYNLSARPLYQMQSLCLHEAVPGHHLQLALQAELELHPLRRQSTFTAFVEGWGLYAEKLGYELGFYKDPYQEFGHLSMEAWRACRLVVDTGIHAKLWTRAEAIQYMKANTALSEHNIVAEVDRYIGWPGQSLGYKVGERFILDLRKRAEQAFGKTFNLKDFHEAVLASGSVPLPVLEMNVKSWMENQAAIQE